MEPEQIAINEEHQEKDCLHNVDIETLVTKLY